MSGGTFIAYGTQVNSVQHIISHSPFMVLACLSQQHPPIVTTTKHAPHTLKLPGRDQRSKAAAKVNILSDLLILEILIFRHELIHAQDV